MMLRFASSGLANVIALFFTTPSTSTFAVYAPLCVFAKWLVICRDNPVVRSASRDCSLMARRCATVAIFGAASFCLFGLFSYPRTAEIHNMASACLAVVGGCRCEGRVAQIGAIASTERTEGSNASGRRCSHVSKRSAEKLVSAERSGAHPSQGSVPPASSFHS